MVNKDKKDKLEIVEEVAKIRRQKKVITNKIIQVDETLDNFDPKVHSINNIKACKPILDGSQVKYDKLNERLCNILDDNEFAAHTDEINKFNELILQIQSKLQDYMDHYEENKSTHSHNFDQNEDTIIAGSNLISSTLLPNNNAELNADVQIQPYDTHPDDQHEQIAVNTQPEASIINTVFSQANPIYTSAPVGQNANQHYLHPQGQYMQMQPITNPGQIQYINNPVNQPVMVNQQQHRQPIPANLLHQNVNFVPAPTYFTTQQPYYYSVKPAAVISNIPMMTTAVSHAINQPQVSPAVSHAINQPQVSPAVSAINQPPVTTAHSTANLQQQHDIQDASVNAVSHNFKKMSIKTPPLDIPIFDGNPIHWLTFKQTFQAIIHNRNDLDDIIKFSFLIKHLSGKAAQGLGHINLTSEGYNSAWQNLLVEYDNSCLLVDTHMEHLLNLPYCNKESASDLRILLNACQLHISTLAALNLKLDSFGERIVVTILKKRIDPNSRKLLEEKQEKNQFTSYEDLVKFLQRRCQILDSLESVKKPFFPNKNQSQQPTSKPSNSKSFSITNSDGRSSTQSNESKSSNQTLKSKKVYKKCYICQGGHRVFNCLRFLKMPIIERMSKVKENKACINCLNIGHLVDTCVYNSGCKTCQEKHNTLLHANKVQPCDTTMKKNSPESNQFTFQSSESPETKNYCATKPNHNINKSVMLSTATILIQNSKGEYISCRALLDSGSQSHFITKELSDKLKLPKIPSNGSVSLLNQNQTSIDFKILTKIKSRITDFNNTCELQIIPSITNSMPSSQINISRWTIPHNIKLADPSFNQIGRIDLLLGADIYYKILKPEKLHVHNDQPVLVNTLFGWIFGGSFNNQSSSFCGFQNQTSIQNEPANLNALLPQFWGLEEFSQQKYLSKEEQLCEEHFARTYTRDDSGRYVIRLPFRDSLQNLGESKPMALKRFSYLERKLQNEPILRKEYTEFINNYLFLGHMKQIDESVKLTNQLTYYLPHHCIVKLNSSTTKYRVVFDASAKSNSNVSLNDVLMIGPTVQDDLFSIILRFRKHKWVFTTDIQKMYRQIVVHPDDTKFQRILWRDNPDKEIKTFELTTVTYGTAAAPYLATKTLQQLSIDEESSYPLAAKIASEDFYVDDLLTGTNNLDEAVVLQQQMISFLNSGGFKLHKWCSNSPKILENLETEDLEILQGENCGNQSIKALGLQWQPTSDTLIFITPSLNSNEKFTKRSILSSVAKLYDPLGLLSPTIIIAKLLIQTLWKCKNDWDHEISERDKSAWLAFRDNMKHINKIQLPRHVFIANASTVELHGFSDASEAAYGACVYIRCIKDSEISVKLLCSKSRAAPLKTITLARLELCAALLLSQLVNKSIKSLKFTFNSVQLWTDSEITLAWIKTETHKLKTFVAHRVSEIQSLTENFNWFHVPTSQNPADLISRGVMPQKLVNNTLWWEGPQFLHQENYNHILTTTGTQIDNEVTPFTIEFKNQTFNAVVPERPDFNLFSRYSSFEKLQRITALCLRFIFNYLNKNKRKIGPLTSVDYKAALHAIVKNVQHHSFSKEIATLRKNQQVSNSSTVKSLNPFIDSDNILRVGGRLKNSEYDYDVKHQILLPSKHVITDLIFNSEHLNNCHAGPNLLVSLVRQKFWPIHAKQTAKKIVRSCVICFKFKPQISQQIMGDLPKDRVQPCIPFTVTGVDFCGPFYIKNKNQRKGAKIKIYVAIFVCFSIKAIHMEIATDLTAEGFIACFKRFISRRGKCAILWSDNGTNFTGANTELKKDFEIFQSESNFNKINQYLSVQQIQWKFIPPRSPNFGGLWESSVKSFKTHFKKVVANTILTYEEFNTVLIEIEGILNSRPLYALSDSPNDPEPLTPGHFLRGASITALPEPDLTQLSSNRLSRWQHVQQLTQLFWKKYSVEYVHHLQQRAKWKSLKHNIQEGDIVLISDENIAPTYWLMARVKEVIRGPDKNIRVVKLHTKNGEFTRAISKVCPLPIKDNSNFS